MGNYIKWNIEQYVTLGVLNPCGKQTWNVEVINHVLEINPLRFNIYIVDTCTHPNNHHIATYF